MFTVRRATLDDIDACIDLRLKLFRETGEVQSETPPPELLEATRTYLLTTLPTDRFLSWIAEADGQIIGVSGVVFLEKPPTQPNLSGREAYVMNMYTLPEWRRKGIATALLQEIVQFVKTTNARRIWLRTTPDGKRMYEAHGFTSMKEEMELVW